MMNRRLRFLLHANCVVVAGARRALLCDLQRSRARTIPLALYTILTSMSLLSIGSILSAFDESPVVYDYFDMLVAEDYGMLVSDEDAALFPRMDLSWDRPERVTNAIIDVSSSSKHDYMRLAGDLDGLGCRALQIRSYDPLEQHQLSDILNSIEHFRFRHLDLALCFSPLLTESYLRDLCYSRHVIASVIVHSSPHSKDVPLYPHPVRVTYSKQVISPTYCGHVSPEYFSFTLEHFTEALSHNTCLNRKISVTAQGAIAPCPSLPNTCGNAAATNLADAYNQVRLVQITKVKKDDVLICRDCEFRYCCTDCRAHLSDPTDMYSKPAYCSYDPYTATWH